MKKQNKLSKKKLVIPIILIVLVISFFVIHGIIVDAFAWIIPIITTIIGSTIGGTAASGGTCNVYSPPILDSDSGICESCNNPLQPCTEYRCKAIGYNCQFIEKDKICITTKVTDVTPPRITDCQAKNYEDGNDYQLTKSDDGCTFNEQIPEFSTAAVRLDTNEFSQCRISHKLGTAFDPSNKESDWFGDSSFSLDHYFAITLLDVNETILDRCNNKELCTYYVRCQDSSGNKMQNDFSINFKIKPGPDLQPPEVVDTIVESGSEFPYGKTSLDFEIVAFDATGIKECRYSTVDEDFETMDDKFICKNQLILQRGGFICTTNITGLKSNDVENNFFIRCQDNSDNKNTNKESFEFMLKGSTPLEIESASMPSGTLLSKRGKMTINTNKDARCFYILNKDEEKLFNETGSLSHVTHLIFDKGSNKLEVKCVDDAGNIANKESTATLENDNSYPIITRVYKEYNQLTIVTAEESTCNYNTETSSFSFDDKKASAMTSENTEEHSAQLIEGETYYIICRDSFNNNSPVYIVNT